MANTPSSLCAVARRLFTDGPLVLRMLQHWRPMIAPFGTLIDQVPTGSSILDVGCGGGLFLILLAAEGRIARGLGFDANASAIDLANGAAAHLADTPVTFECRPVQSPWPDASFDVVSVIDLLHHIPSAVRPCVGRDAAARVRPGGLLLLKDMTERPIWRVAANVLHDLVVARQWVSFPKRGDMLAWGAAEGLHLVRERIDNMWWYGHRLLVFRKPEEGEQR